MNTGIVTGIFVCVSILMLAGCASTVSEQQTTPVEDPMISAAEFEAMINIEVTVLEPAPAAEATLAATR